MGMFPVPHPCLAPACEGLVKLWGTAASLSKSTAPRPCRALGFTQQHLQQLPWLTHPINAARRGTLPELAGISDGIQVPWGTECHHSSPAAEPWCQAEELRRSRVWLSPAGSPSWVSPGQRGAEQPFTLDCGFSGKPDWAQETLEWEP